MGQKFEGRLFLAFRTYICGLLFLQPLLLRNLGKNIILDERA